MQAAQHTRGPSPFCVVVIFPDVPIGEDQLTGVISTASFGSPGKMSLRFKSPCSWQDVFAV
jgi:hypothetical protein